MWKFHKERFPAVSLKSPQSAESDLSASFDFHYKPGVLMASYRSIEMTSVSSANRSAVNRLLFILLLRLKHLMKQLFVLGSQPVL